MTFKFGIVDNKCDYFLSIICHKCFDPKELP